MNSIIKNEQPSFWFGGEPHTFCGFFRTAALRYCILMPLLMIWSHTLFSAGPYIAAALWFLGAGWLSLRKTVFSSWQLIALLPLILWTFAGLFSYGTPEFRTVHHYFSLYPYCFILVYAVLLKNKESRYAVISSISFALFIVFCWAITVHIVCRDIPRGTFNTLRMESLLYLFRHSIGCGTAFVFWGGLWCCFPYSSRHINWCRKIFPKKLLDAMESAADISLWKLCRIFTAGIERRCSLAVLLSILRWSVIIGVLIYTFGFGNSRTAQCACFICYSALLLKWKWKAGLLITFFVLLPFCLLVSNFSDTFEQKSSRTIDDIKVFWNALGNRQELQHFAEKNHDRLGIWASVIYDIAEEPVTGYGIGKSSAIVRERTGWCPMTHSEFVFLVLERGFIALGCFLLWWFVLLGTSLKNKTVFGTFGLFSALLIVINCWFNNAMQDQAADMYLLMLAVISTAPCGECKSRGKNESQTVNSV